MAVRDQDIAAEIIGINIYRYKLLAFAISSFYAGVCGALYTYYFGIRQLRAVPAHRLVDYLAMIIIGGLGSVLGSILGAIFVHCCPLSSAFSWRMSDRCSSSRRRWQTSSRGCGWGCLALIILFLIVEPEGSIDYGENIRSYFRVWPFSY